MTLLFLVALMWDIPGGAGKDATVKYCADCHSAEQAVSLRQGKQEWAATIEKMVGMGAKIPEDSYDSILGYLTKHFGEDAPIQIKVNKASAVDLESLLLLKRSEAAAVIQYRGEHGDFKSLDDLRKVPGVDFKKIEAKKDLIVF
jgi:competence protein ComEA